MIFIEITVYTVLFTLGLWVGIKIVAPASRKNHIITAFIFGLVFTGIQYIPVPIPITALFIIGFWILAAFTYELGFGQMVIVIGILVALIFLSGHILDQISMHTEIPR